MYNKHGVTNAYCKYMNCIHANRIKGMFEKTVNSDCCINSVVGFPSSVLVCGS